MAIVRCFVLCEVLIGLVMATGNFIVLKSPKYVGFVHDANAIESNEIGSVISASFGLPLNRDLKWNGLEEVNMFRRPKATAVLSVKSVPSDRLSVEGVARYKTVEVESGLDTAEVVSTIENIDWKTDPLTVDFSVDGNLFSIYSRRSELFADLPVSLPVLRDDVESRLAGQWFQPTELASLNVTLEPDLAFVGELYMIQQIVSTLVNNKASLQTHSPDFFHFSVNGLEVLTQAYGIDSVQYGDAVKLLETVIARISDQLQSLYGDDVVIDLVTFSPDATNKPLVRRGRSLLQAAAVTEATPGATGQTSFTKSQLKLAPIYTDQYSAIFNICLWFMIVFSIVLFYIAWAIWFMDPGRDSIIYRMTSTRMKRD